MAKYDPLRDHLAAVAGNTQRVTMSFAEVAALVGPLPRSAWEHRAWWANDSEVRARSWKEAGRHVAWVSQTGERVVFARGAAR